MTKMPYPHSKNGKKAIKQAKKVEKNGLKKPIKKFDKNRVYAWVLLVLMVFWTFASVLSIMNAFGKDTKTISASAEEVAVNVDYDGMTIDPFQYPTANLLNWPYSTIQKNIDGVDFSVHENGTLNLNGTCSETTYKSFSVNTKNVYFFGGATYTLTTYLLSGSINLQNAIVVYMACQLQDGTTQTLANGSRVGTSISFQVPQNAKFLYLTLYFANYYTDIICDNANIGIMYNQGDVAYPYQPPYQLVYANGYNNGADSSYNSGYVAGVQEAKYGFWQGCIANVNLYYYDASFVDEIQDTFTFQPLLISNGISIANLVSVVQDKIPEGGAFVDCYITFSFSPAVPINNFNISAMGNGAIFYQTQSDTWKNFTITTDDGTFLAPFVMDEYTVPSYVLTYDKTLQAGKAVNSIGSFVFDTIDYIKDFKLISSDNSYLQGFQAGKDIGKDDYLASEEYKLLIDNIKRQSFEQGKVIGYDQGVQSANDYSFFSLLSAVVDAPLAMFKDMFNFEILGVNLSSFALGLLTLAMVLGVVKLIL